MGNVLMDLIEFVKHLQSEMLIELWGPSVMNAGTVLDLGRSV